MRPAISRHTKITVSKSGRRESNVPIVSNHPTVAERLGLKQSGVTTPLSELPAGKVTPAVEQEMEKTLPEHHDAPDLDKHGYRIPVETGVELFDNCLLYTSPSPRDS